jgi:hypothetical protein
MCGPQVLSLTEGRRLRMALTRLQGWSRGLRRIGLPPWGLMQVRCTTSLRVLLLAASLGSPPKTTSRVAIQISSSKFAKEIIYYRITHLIAHGWSPHRISHHRHRLQGQQAQKQTFRSPCIIDRIFVCRVARLPSSSLFLVRSLRAPLISARRSTFVSEHGRGS